jgi:hypothetical protein
MINRLAKDFKFKIPLHKDIEESTSKIDVCPYTSHEFIKKQFRMESERIINHEFKFTYELSDEDINKPSVGYLKATTPKDTEQSLDESVQTETDEKEYENIVAKFNRLCLRYSEK